MSSARRLAGWWPAFAFLGTTSALGLFDAVSDPDRPAGEMLFDTLETALLVGAVVGVLYLSTRFRQQHREQLRLLHDLEVARAEGAKWRTGARDLINGLGEAIDVQFGTWELTPAEREVALLLLKGLSLHEVATVRSTSERTVRQQARCVYRKAGLSGRAALSAYFLEDLLAPAHGYDES